MSNSDYHQISGPVAYQDVLSFWFDTLRPEDWWKKDSKLDRIICEEFRQTLDTASSGGLKDWRTTPSGRLAEILVLDQFTRNIYRDSAQAFMNDDLALALAEEAINEGADIHLNTERRAFMYMPYMHSESAAVHETALELFNQPGMELQLEFEIKHKVIIDRFGRYPHRNELLSRISTNDELDFLKEDNSSF